jgi:nucleoside 2-deoxyribosyltransferase
LVAQQRCRRPWQVAMKKIYLAGPDVFLKDGREIGRRKREMCAAFDFEGLFPLDQSPEIETDARAIFAANRALLQQAEIGLFNLSPFRGPSADPGTVFELGVLFQRGKPLFGYSNTAALYQDRVAGPGAPTNFLTDSQGHLIENFQLIDNLMIVRAIEESGGEIVTREETDNSAANSLTAFAAFVACIEVIVQRCGCGKLTTSRSPFRAINAK